MEDMNHGCGTYRRVENSSPYLLEAQDKGCGLWLMLDPLCHPQALAQLWTDEPDAEKTILFSKTPLAATLEASPRLVPITPDSPILRWIGDTAPLAWGMLLASDAPFHEVLAHLRSLLLVKSDGGDVVFRFWDGNVLTRICRPLPKETPVILGPVRRVLTLNDEKEWVCGDRDTDFMAAPPQPRPVLPSPWYCFTLSHERLFHDKRPEIVASNVTEALLRPKMEHGLVLPRHRAGRT